MDDFFLFLVNKIRSVKNWSNQNSGFLTLFIFFATIFLGWISGTFRALRRKPKLKIDLLPGPTFCCTILTGRKWNEHPTKRTLIALYLQISNVGQAPTEISDIHIGYHNYTYKYTFLWIWLKKWIIALSDFQVGIGENIKVYPFLIQRSILTPKDTKNYLREGEKTNGVIYYETPEFWGGYQPRECNRHLRIKLCVIDVYNRKYKKIMYIPILSYEEAKKYNPNLGLTREISEAEAIKENKS